MEVLLIWRRRSLESHYLQQLRLGLPESTDHQVDIERDHDFDLPESFHMPGRTCKLFILQRLLRALTAHSRRARARCEGLFTKSKLYKIEVDTVLRKKNILKEISARFLTF
jgi:hypothetical protein